jgi:hypothetical protein
MVKTKVVSIVVQNFHDFTLVGGSKKLTKLSVVRFFHGSHFIQLHGHLKILQELFKGIINLNGKSLNLKLLQNIGVQESLNNFGIHNLTSRSTLTLGSLRSDIGALASGTVLRGCFAGASLGLRSGDIEFGVILHNSVEHNHELAKETSEYGDLVLVWCSETVNINNFTEDDSFNGYTLCDIGGLNLFS